MARTKKAETAAAKTTAAKTTTTKTTAKAAAEKAPAKRTRKKKVVPNFVIQSSADQSVTYEAVLEKINAAFDGEVASVDVYVKAEEGKAYYVINGDVTGAVELF